MEEACGLQRCHSGAVPGRFGHAEPGIFILNLCIQPQNLRGLKLQKMRWAAGVICPAVDCPTSKMSQSSTADEGTTFENLWSTLEPDSTYFELPQAGHSGDRVASSSRAEVCMDLYHMRDMRDMNDNVMSQYSLLSSSMEQGLGNRAASTSPYSSETTSNVPTPSPYSQPNSTFEAMSPAPAIPSNTDYPGPHNFEVTFQQSSTAKSATWTKKERNAGLKTA
ncbi:tumor protein p73-like [Sinocyclocheilus rhinocerous]|uniref:tumor protein p73-like n=1 Tax=Sinocyclocheilus rhinocerous TaxID=307959 RepID=UPI0007BA2228|nr:PREDICTED: tumor protein p73-like [Sinocyclocheilus rhinocerous]